MGPAIILVLVLYLISQTEAQLQVGFYKNSCPAAESIVCDEVFKAFKIDNGIAPGLVRMHFHDCFVRGADGSVLIDSTPNNVAEKDGPPNGITLRGFEVIERAKARIEAQCRGVVSCADILAFAARDSVVATEGFGWDVPAGRRDGRVSRAIETFDLPPPFFNLDQLTQSFAKKGLTQEEMVTLSGAHTIGRSHCTSFSNRLYNFSAATSQDPSLDPFYAAQLKQQCPRDPQGSIDPNLVVPMNGSPALLESSYYRDVLAHRGLFTSDQSLITSPATFEQVKFYAFKGVAWQLDFVRAMIKMSQIELEAQLQVGFYSSSCRIAEFIVKDEVRKGFFSDRGVAAGLVRLHFHDCFVRGCDASVLIDTTPSNTAEKDSPANNPSLRGFEVIDKAKARLEAACKGVVSCADTVAFAARDSVEITGGLGYDVPAGRRDGRVSLSSEASANLPPPFFNVNQLTQSFANKGLTQEEMVTLSGAHTIGRSHCTSFSNRLYSYNTTSSQDPSLDKVYAGQLKQQCPQGSTKANLVVPMNPATPSITDVGYYVDVLANRGLLTSDQTLLTNSATANQVSQNAGNPLLWRSKFAAAMVKMGQIGVTTGTAGEIRANCRVING
ncbi:hypothetical protein RJ639_001751 [Escallonia herrerae]|uniref:peroxidase n=1 Tax=Escallonia herrerae TaxID=1293975 RepID=A0AA88XCL1_9ASTE|nr:hypothetical protein RJ639_001751 [Escallonia herrerae]